MNQPNCNCGDTAKCFTVRKEGPNTGRKFYTCANNRTCKFFEWVDGNNYNPEKFKTGACYRCGRWGCDATDCDEEYDWFGNKIPENYADYF